MHWMECLTLSWIVVVPFVLSVGNLHWAMGNSWVSFRLVSLLLPLLLVRATLNVALSHSHALLLQVLFRRLQQSWRQQSSVLEHAGAMPLATDQQHSLSVLQSSCIVSLSPYLSILIIISIIHIYALRCIRSCSNACNVHSEVSSVSVLPNNCNHPHRFICFYALAQCAQQCLPFPPWLPQSPETVPFLSSIFTFLHLTTFVSFLCPGYTSLL